MRSDAKKSIENARQTPISDAITASAAALPWQGESHLAALKEVLFDQTSSQVDAKLLVLGHALFQTATAYVATDTRCEGDGSPKADRACAKAWKKCEDVVEGMIALPAAGLAGLRIKAHAVSWIESDKKDDLRKSIVADLIAVKDLAAGSGPASGLPAGTRGPSTDDLESALMDASMLSHLACHAVCQLGFESIEPLKLSGAETELVYWSVSHLSWTIDRAKAALLGEELAT